jgi:hypothetical protein
MDLAFFSNLSQRGNYDETTFPASRCAGLGSVDKSDGTLDGIWGGYGSDKTGTEKATKQ